MFPYEQADPELLAKIHKGYGMTPESIKRDVQTLKDWMAKQPHLPNITDDILLERFLQHSKNRMERAKMKLDAYYSVKNIVPEFFTKRDPLSPEIARISKTVFFCTLPKTTPERDRVYINKFFDYDPKKFNITSFMKMGFGVIESQTKDNLCNRLIIVYDLSGISMGHAAACTYPVLKNLMVHGLNSLPQRFSAFHVINPPPFSEVIINKCKSFLNPKLAARVHVHSCGSETFFDFVPRDIVPKEYGGTYDLSMEEIRDMGYQSLVSYRDWLIDQDNIKTDESKRNTSKPKNDSHLSLEGSFRQIAFD